MSQTSKDEHAERPAHRQDQPAHQPARTTTTTTTVEPRPTEAPVPGQEEADAILEGTHHLPPEERAKRKQEREQREREMNPEGGSGGSYRTR